jgi:hypothetical protein
VFGIKKKLKNAWKEARVSLFIAEILGKPLLSLSFNHSERIHRKYIKNMYFIDRFVTYYI